MDWEEPDAVFTRKPAESDLIVPTRTATRASGERDAFTTQAPHGS
jgi:hypothetical protein